MVKYPAIPSISSPPKIRIPLKVIIFWYKKISSYINSKKISSFENRECPTIYISKKYPKMSILELYERIKHHLSKYFPDIYQKLNSNPNKKCLIKLKKIPKELNDTNKENNIELSNNNKTKKNIYVLIKTGKKNKFSEKIRLKNEKNCEIIKHLFEPHKFDENILEKYNNCTIKEILLINNKNENNNENNEKDNDKNDDNNESSSSNNDDDISPCKSTSSNSSSSLHFNKINFLTHFRKAPKISKYFNNDEYFSNKLKSIGNYDKK